MNPQDHESSVKCLLFDDTQIVTGSFDETLKHYGSFKALNEMECQTFKSKQKIRKQRNFQ